MKPAFRKDEAFLADVDAAGREPNALHAWWLGQSGFLVQWNGRRILFDPYLSDSLTRKYQETDKPHVRMTERVIDPGRLTGIEIVTASHNHTDHLDRDTLLPLREANPAMILVIPEANRALVADRLGTDPAWPIGLDDGASRDIDGIACHGVASAHDTLQTDALGRHHFLGFVVRLGPWTLYHSGDTRLYDGLADRLRAFPIDLAFLPINGWRPERRVAGNLDAAEAVRLAREVGLRRVVPHHFDMFAFNTADPADFAAEAQQNGQPATVLRNGERITLHPTPPLF
jgi:L-ascorbate metabolism protein UlaG (beta-lactamase superfamily)